MKLWIRIKQLQRHRWLPFFLPVIGTLIYIVLAVLAIPSEFGDKSESEAPEVEKPVRSKKAAQGAEAVRRATHPESASTANALSPTAPAANQ